jgi:hypothetical protein
MQSVVWLLRALAVYNKGCMLNPISVRIDPMAKLHGAQKELCEFSHKRLRHKKKKKNFAEGLHCTSE